MEFRMMIQRDIKYTLFLFFVCFTLLAAVPVSLFSQITFQKIYKQSGKDNAGNSISLSNGDYLLLGGSSTGAQILKTDSGGRLISAWKAPVANGIKKGKSDNLILTRPATIRSFNYTTEGLEVMEVDKKMGIQWRKFYFLDKAPVNMFMDSRIYESSTGSIILTGIYNENTFSIGTSRNATGLYFFSLDSLGG